MIGGEHHLQVPPAVDDSLGDLLANGIGNVSLFSTGRDALACLLAGLPEEAVWLPDLMCTSVHDACQAAGKKRNIYKVTDNFAHDATFDPREHPATIVFVMHYFGILNETLMRQARRAGVTVVSDVTHLLFDRPGLESASEQSDFLVASLRKSGPFPDGGFVSSRAYRPAEAMLGIRDEFLSRRTTGLLSRGFSAAEDFNDDENFVILKQAEAQLDASRPAGHRCSHLTRSLLRTLPVAGTAARIRRNTATLAANLQGLGIVRAGSNAVSPYFPCTFRDAAQRDLVRARLAARRCHAPIHWPAAGLPVQSPLSELGLSLPCDARYDETDMHTLSEVIRSCLENH